MRRNSPGPLRAGWRQRSEWRLPTTSSSSSPPPVTASRCSCCHSQRPFCCFTEFCGRRETTRAGGLRKHDEAESRTDDGTRKTPNVLRWLLLAHVHARTQIAFGRHLPSCWRAAFRRFPPMNIKYKHLSKFSTPGPYFMPLSWDNKHISFPLPNSAPKMNLSPLYKIICPHYVSG